MVVIGWPRSRGHIPSPNNKHHSIIHVAVYLTGKSITDRVRYLGFPLAMSTLPNDELIRRKWFKQKFRSIFSPKSPSRNLDMSESDAQLISTNVLPINAPSLAAQGREKFPSDGPCIIEDCTGSGE